MFKKPFISLFLILIQIFSIHALRADEGMWLPNLLKALKEKEMKKAGLKISVDEIYSINKSSMKDAVVLFGRGCTGELISNEGLLLTNHHCGFSQIQSHSSLENDYLKNGFWAMNKSQELKNPGLTVTFIVSIADVTTDLLKGINANMTEAERELQIGINSLEVVNKAKEGSHYEAIIKPMYNGNVYYLFVTETFKDIRMVGAPPMNMGNFGRDSDNWTWPRHTADFSLFRIYAGPDNKPADYSTENVPYKPKHFFPISLKGVEENSFTMVYGFPARTNEYLSSYAVEQIINLSNPLKIELRADRLAVFNEFMNQDRQVFIQYADKYSSVSNYHKKWSGETKGLKSADALAKKIAFEEKFTQRASSNEAFKPYLELLPALKQKYVELEEHQHELDLLTEGIFSIELIRFANNFREINDKLTDEQRIKLVNTTRSHFKNYHLPIDKKISGIILNKYFKYSKRGVLPEFYTQQIVGKSFEDLSLFNELLFEKSIFIDSTRIFELLNNLDENALKIFQNDPVFLTATHFFNFYVNDVSKAYNQVNEYLIPLNRTYMEAQRVLFTEKIFYPDANQTLRVSFGKAEGYQPFDGVQYLYFTTSNGIFEKNQTQHPDYEANERLLDLIAKKDFGPYADKDGNLRTCFAASNHTTGGNSGSPVLNGNGQLIGTNFDRNWEGTMSDIFYDVNQVRNISLDIRYTLFIIDKYAGAGYLLDEMKIIR